MASNKVAEKGHRDFARIEGDAIGTARLGLVLGAAPPRNEPFCDIADRHLKRRSFLKGAAAMVPA